MKIDVKIYGNVQNISQSEYTVKVLGSIDIISLSSKYCDQEKVLFFQSPYEGVVIEGSDLKVKDLKNGKVLISGIVFTLKLLNKEEEIAKRYNVKTCCINITEAPEEEADEEEDEDLLDDSFFDED